MKRIKYICMLLLCFVFIPKVYAFTYDIETYVENTLVESGSVEEIQVVLKDVQGVSGGFGACSMNIEFDGEVSLNGEVRASDGWDISFENNYSFDTSESFIINSKIFDMKVKIDNVGTIKFTNITCSDGKTNESISDKVLNFNILENVDISNMIEEDERNKEDIKNELDTSSTNISSIEFSEGAIDFDPEITEYTITVRDFDNLQVSVELESKSSSYTMGKTVVEDDKIIIISVTASDDTNKTYTIYVNESDSLGEEDSDASLNGEDNDGSLGEKNNFVLIFIVIICILVLINVFRIVRKLKK